MGRLILHSIKISHFRTHKLSKFSFTEKPTVIFGCNGAGKTNVLEAISLLAPGRGFRNAKAEDLSRRPELLGWKLTANIESNGNKHEICTWWNSQKNRRVTVDEKLVTQVELGRLTRILWITPLMDRIWLEGSSERRSFLDRIVSTIFSEHTPNLLRYHKALRQRNKLLKDKSSDLNWFRVLEHQMASAGAEIEVARRNSLARIVDMQAQSTSSFPAADLNLLGSDFMSAEQLEFQFGKNREKDFWAGRTLLGPHLTDLSAVHLSKSIEAKNCSTGEQKALLISIILAVARIQIDQFGVMPLLLFDEVSAHLDRERRSILYDEICNLDAQVFLTGTDKMIFEDLTNQAQFFSLDTKFGETICK